MIIRFHKYQGTGNDFILIDNRNGEVALDVKQIEFLCSRKFGIGADGLILLENETDYDFRMVYHNSDGKPSSMCGNGGRCITMFAKQLGIIRDKAVFNAPDGIHEASLDEDLVALRMQDVIEIEQGSNYVLLNTGSPHYVTEVKGLGYYDVFNEGRKIRSSERFKPEGTNVDFFERVARQLFVRTYERGVEQETLSCGTGVTAAAIAAAIHEPGKSHMLCPVKTLGGDLEVEFDRTPSGDFRNIWLKGPVRFVFDGKIEI
jgi:diaminopimelate epimerase